MNADDKIREILRLEAGEVEPSPAGWDAIQAGVAARRSRAWWTLGAAVAGTAALVVGAVVFVAADHSSRGIHDLPVTTEPPIAESPTASPSASPPAAPAPNEPINAIWPLTTTDEVARWAADRSTYPSLAAASTSVLAFARGYLGIADPEVVALEGSYGENRFEVRRDGILASTVTVRGFGADGTAPFVATKADAPDATISSPASGSAVSGSFTARGSYEAVDPAFTVTLFADTGSTAPVELASVRATTGPEGWTAPLTFTTNARTGSLRITNPSLRDGGTATAGAIPLVFGEVTAAGPKAMVAQRDGGIAVISTANGEVVRWLVPPSSKAYDPELSADGKTVVYAQQAGVCASAVLSVPVAGGEPTELAGGWMLEHPSRRGSVLTYLRTRCTPAGEEHAIVVEAGTTIVREVATPAAGPVAGGRFVAYTAMEGGRSVLHTIDAHGELADNPVTAPADCLWSAVAWGPAAPDGREQLFVAASCSPSDEVVEARLYRFDQDARHQTLVTRWEHLLGVTTLDFAGDDLVVGTRTNRAGAVAHAWVDGTLRAIPGEAYRPTWS